MEAFRMMTMAYGNLVAQAVYVAAKLGLADLMADAPRTVHELATASGAHVPSVERLLRALVSLDVFAPTERGRFTLTPLGATLRSGVPGSVRAAVIMAGDPTFNAACDQMLHSVLTGRPAFDHVHGAGFFGYLAKNPTAAAVFNDGMANFSATENAAIAGSYDFSSVGSVVDVGGGHGGFLAEILKAHRKVRGVLYDLADVVREASFIEAAGVAERCTILAGNFFESVPAGGDVYVLKRILHDWDDETCVSILRRCREAMRRDGRVLVVDAVVPEGSAPHPSKIADLLMMVLLTGRERTETEFRALYEAAGLKLTEVVPTPSTLSIVEGLRA